MVGVYCGGWRWRSLLNSKLRSKGNAHMVGLYFYAAPNLLEIGCPRSRSCGQKVTRVIWSCRLTLCGRGKCYKFRTCVFALSLDNCRACQTTLRTVLVDRNVETLRFEPRRFLINFLYGNCGFGAVFGSGRPAAVLGAPNCVAKVRLSVVNGRVFQTAFCTVLVCSCFVTLRFGRCRLCVACLKGSNGGCLFWGLAVAFSVELQTAVKM